MSVNGSPTPAGLDIDAARKRIIDLVVPIADIEQSPLSACWRRVLARDLVSPIDVPAYDNSAMDGIACRFSDLQTVGPTRLPIAGASLAGHSFETLVPTGSALRIMTGAYLPDGLDTIVPQELCQIEGDTVLIPPGQVAGQHCRSTGEDLRRGSVALRAGRLLNSGDLGLAASLGYAELELVRKPRVALFSTGDELLEPGTRADPRRIFDSNRFTLASLLRDLGLESIDLGIVADQPAELERALERSHDCDLVISSGGVSVGEADHTRAVMNRFGRIEFATLAIRPGRPVAFGQIGRAWYFGLPGNPVAVMITYLFLVRSAIYALMGARPPQRFTVRATADEAIRKKPGRTEFQRGIASTSADGQLHVRLTGQQGSGVLHSMSSANCIVVLPSGQGAVAAGDRVDIALFDGLM